LAALVTFFNTLLESNIFWHYEKMKRMPQITSFLLFIALCVSAAYWGMQLFNPPLRAVAAPPQSIPTPSLDAAASLLGGQATAVVASNFQLTGVVMATNPAESVAILAANGKKPQAVRTNAEVVPGVTVKEVQRDHVLLSQGGVIKRVELPKDAKRR
jgi:general secretion pathway protein C